MKERNISSLSEFKPGDHIKTTSQLHELHIYHHLLVIKVVSENKLQVIHNDGTVVVEETKKFSPEDITVLDYPSAYSTKYII